MIKFPTSFLRYADYDPTYTGHNRLSVYKTKGEQRGNRPDLDPIPVIVIPLTSEAVEALALQLASVGMRREIYGSKNGKRMWPKLMPETRASWLRTARNQLASIGIESRPQ